MNKAFMNIWKALKLRWMVRGFEKGITTCQQCGGRFRFDTLTPLSLIQCSRCQCPNIVPMPVGPYWLYQPLGGGGSGSVYMGFHTRRPLRCAIKVMHVDEKNYDKAVAMMKREADILKHVTGHPNVVRYIECGQDAEEFFLAMEFVDGERLDHRLTRNEVIPEEQALLLLRQLIAAEKHILKRNYLYADMKPENIIITPRRHRPVVIDFGLCMTVEEAAVDRKRSFVGGSPYYLPPERIERRAEGPWSEIYSLGMIMFAVLTGQTFFKFSGSVQDLALKHVQSARLAVTPAMMPGCSPVVVELVGHMIRRDPEERYRTFEDLDVAVLQCLQMVRR